jgi:CO dehydrogenase/acetyl-CoA synthase delta subunit
MKEIPNIFYDNYLKKLLIDKDKFNEFVKKYTNEIEIVVLNSENKEIGNKTYKIIIGGHLLSRGNTFENLMVELFLNTPSDAVHVDTLLQRCR